MTDYALSGAKESTPPASPAVMEEHPVTLTRQEQEVAELVGRDLTNRQIGKELVVSERTVEKLVANILKKLGLHSRDQVAARIAKQ